MLHDDHYGIIFEKKETEQLVYNFFPAGYSQERKMTGDPHVMFWHYHHGK